MVRSKKGDGRREKEGVGSKQIADSKLKTQNPKLYY
jgi:hypothetical protein